MSETGAFVVVGSSTFAQLCAGWLAVLPIAAMAIYGWSRGMFLAMLAALQVLAAFLAAVTLAEPVSAVVASLGCPATQSLALAYVLVFATVLFGTHLAVGATVPDGACRWGAASDQVGGAVFGVGAGFVLGGAILVGWSMVDMPNWLRLDNTHQPLDSGGRTLWTYARFASNSSGWKVLLDGDPPAVDGAAADVIRASEPFVDFNRNGCWDAGSSDTSGGEPYLDIDADGRFTPEMSWIDESRDGRRTVGLRDCYRLADWRRARVMHAPRIDSADAAEVQENTPEDQIAYQAQATDVDGDAITFAIEPVAAPEGEAGEDEKLGMDPGLTIDPQTGAVKLTEAADFERSKSHPFVIVATDATGLATRKTVRIRVRDVLVESKEPQ